MYKQAACRSVLAALTLIGANALLSPASHADVVDVDAIPAVWKEQQIRFEYSTPGGIYSCSALQSKLRALLSDLGADQGLEINMHSCVAGSRGGFTGMGSGLRYADPLLDGATNPTLTITLRSLVQETPEARAELAANRSQAELKALVRREGNIDDTYGATVAGQWKPVRLSGRTRYLDGADCSLLEQLRTQVFAKMAVRVVKDAGTCNRRDISLRFGQPNLHVEALVPAHRYSTVVPRGAG